MQTFWLRAEHGLMPIAEKNNDDIHESALVLYCCCQGSLFAAFKRDALPSAKPPTPTGKGKCMWICPGVFECYILHFLAVQTVRLGALSHIKPSAGEAGAQLCLSRQQVTSCSLATGKRPLRVGAERTWAWGSHGSQCWEEPLRRHPGALAGNITPELVNQSFYWCNLSKNDSANCVRCVYNVRTFDPLILCLGGGKRSELLRRCGWGEGWMRLKANLCSCITLLAAVGNTVNPLMWELSKGFLQQKIKRVNCSSWASKRALTIWFYNCSSWLWTILGMKSHIQ